MNVGVYNMQITIYKFVCIDSCTFLKVGGKLGEQTKKRYIIVNEEQENWSPKYGERNYLLLTSSSPC